MPVISFADFGGGLWMPGDPNSGEDEPGFAVPENGLLVADDVEFLPSGAVRARRGSVKYRTPGHVGPILSLARFYPRPAGQPLDGANGRASVVSSVGTQGWQNPDGILVLKDGSEATVNFPISSTTSTNWLVLTGMFASRQLPDDAVVTGVEVRIWRRMEGHPTSLITDLAVALLVGDTFLGGESRAKVPPWPISLVPVLETYGGEGDLWGWTPLEIASSLDGDGFGVGIQATGANAAFVSAAFVDLVQVRIWYSSSLEKQFLSAYSFGGELFYRRETPGAAFAIPGGTLVDPGRRPRILAWPEKGQLFVFDGVNRPQRYGGARMGPVLSDSDVGLPPRLGPYAALHKGRIYATEPSEIGFSVYACDVQNERRWRPEVHLSANDEGGGEITGLASFRDTLLIFKSTCIFSFIGDPDPLSGAGLLTMIDSRNGCIAPDTVQVTPMGVIYLAREGLRITDGERSRELSVPVRSLFVSRATEQVFSGAVGVYFPRRRQYWLKLDPAQAEGWVVHMMGEEPAWSRMATMPMNCGVVFEGSGDSGEFYLGDPAGFIWQRDVGVLDDGQTYLPGIVTRYALLDEQRHMGRAYEARVLFRSDGGAFLNADVRYDMKNPREPYDVRVQLSTPPADPSAAIRWSRRYINDKTKFGRFVSAGANPVVGATLWELYRIDLDVQMRGYKPWR